MRRKLLEKYGSAAGQQALLADTPEPAGKGRVLVAADVLARLEERHILLSDVEGAVVGAEAQRALV